MRFLTIQALHEVENKHAPVDSPRDGHLTLDDTMQLAHTKTFHKWAESETTGKNCDISIK